MLSFHRHVCKPYALFSVARQQQQQVDALGGRGSVNSDLKCDILYELCSVVVLLLSGASMHGHSEHRHISLSADATSSAASAAERLKTPAAGLYVA